MTEPLQPNPKPESSDRDLLTHFVRQWDEGSFRLLVTRHGALVWSVCRRMLACHQDQEDVFQATFLKLLMHSDRTVWHETLGGWLHKVAYRLSLKICAMRAREQAMDSEIEPSLEGEDCLEKIQRQDSERALHEAIAQLPRRDRQAIVLYYFQNKSREEAAAEMGCSIQAFKGLLHRGRRKLFLRLSVRGLSCSAALVALEQAVTAAAPRLPELIEKTVLVGLNYHPMGGSGMPNSSRVEQLCHREIMSVLQSGLANKSLAFIGCTTLLCTGLLGVFVGGYGGTMAHAAPVLNCQESDKNEAPAAARLAQDRAAKPQAGMTPDEIKKIIDQLNANTQAERNAAIERLKAIGEPALPLLVAAIRESKDRSFRKLAKQTHKDISKEVFIDGLQDKMPPGWKRFCEIVGDSPTSRRLFAEISEKYGDPIRLSEQNLEKGGEFIIKVINDEESKALELRNWQAVNRDLLATLVFLATDRKIQAATKKLEALNKPIQHDRMLEIQLIVGASKRWLTENPDDETYKVLRRLVFELQTQQSEMTPFGIHYVTCHNLEDWGMQEEQMEMITKCLSVGLNDVIESDVNKKLGEGLHEGAEHAQGSIFPSVYDIAYFIHTLGRLGDETHIPMLQPWLDNTSAIPLSPFQVRDAALYALVHLSGQSCQEFGFKHEFDSTAWYKGQGCLLEFSDGEEGRDAAIAKWRAWAKENARDKVAAPAQ